MHEDQAMAYRLQNEECETLLICCHVVDEVVGYSRLRVLWCPGAGK